MKLIRVGPGAIFHRFHSPNWAHLPTSSAGSAMNGGRFNRPGVEALYLSIEPETALAEYRQGATITPPGTLVAYRVDVDGVVDFSGSYDPAIWPNEWAEAGCDWKYIARIEGSDPPTWRIGDRLIRDGVKGLLFPSYRHSGGTNLALFTANLGPEDRFVPHDPAGTLRRDQ
ncbi:MAG: RES family NAD+ phosphorylase [Acetobacteraceae bacterium]